MKIILRRAKLSDIPFLVETILEAEKSGTEILSYSTIFGLSEEDVKSTIANMLEEDVDNCELSISSFLLAESDEVPIGAVCAWIEGVDGVSSSTLKGNLLSFSLPKASLDSAQLINQMIKELHIEYLPNTIQVGLVYVKKDARGQGLVGKLVSHKIEELKLLKPKVQDVYVQVFGHNVSAIRAYEKIGFQTVFSKFAKSEEIISYLPSSTKILMKLNK
jgi:ribosomal protein S18 acetylase RimI-like enzyme